MSRNKPSRDDWSSRPLYVFLMRYLPAFRTGYGNLDIPELAAELNFSNESVYRWFRKSRLRPKNVTALIGIIETERNLAVLTEAGIAPPDIRAFDQFVYA